VAEAVERHPLRMDRSWLNAALAFSILLSLGVLLRLGDPGQIASIQNFLLVFGSLLIEAIPFVLLGAVVSAAIEVLVPASTFERLARLPRPVQLPVAGMTGMAFPVCECGSVPVARRLVNKGLTPAAAVTFMLAAPILNPVVIASTVVAYRGRDTFWPMVLGRSALGLVVAVSVGWVVGRSGKAELLRMRAAESHEHPAEDSRIKRFFSHLAGDFVFMGRFLVLGAVIAGLLQTFVPQSIINSVADAPVLSLMAMMTLAFLLSLCSESDAFVAASFLYSATFNRGFFRIVVVTVGLVTLVATLWLEVLIG
jgi:uncharacterized membrane protein YraQ (UPF0718 family)